MANELRNYTGKYVSVNDAEGREWFRGKALGQVKDGVYRFEVFMVGGRFLEAEMVADIGELAVAAVGA